MSLPIVFRRGVGRDLAAAYQWYEQQIAGLGEQFLVEVNASFDAIEQFPGMFAPLYADVRRLLVSRFPYAVFYRVGLGMLPKQCNIPSLTGPSYSSQVRIRSHWPCRSTLTN